MKDSPAVRGWSEHQGQASKKKKMGRKREKEESKRKKEREREREREWKNEQVAGRRAYGLHPYLLTSAK